MTRHGRLSATVANGLYNGVLCELKERVTRYNINMAVAKSRIQRVSFILFMAPNSGAAAIGDTNAELPSRTRRQPLGISPVTAAADRRSCMPRLC